METGAGLAFYQSDLQSLHALLVVPALLAAYLLGSGRARREAAASRPARLLRLYALLFCAQTLLDPIATGPLTAALGLPGLAGTVLMFTFVLLGDFRVLWLVFSAASPGPDPRAAAARAALWTLAVPLATGLLYGSALLLADPPGQLMWLIYELGFASLALALRAGAVSAAVPDDPRLASAVRAALAYATCYYLLWAASDLWILSGSDTAWYLRALPNQLYYAWWVPFAYFRFRRAVV